MSLSLQVSTVRSEDVSIDNSQIIDQASPRNSVYLSPRKQQRSSLPALQEIITGSTHASSGDSVFENIEETEHGQGSVSKGRLAFDNSTRHAHNDPTRHVSNIGSHPSRGQPTSKFDQRLPSPRYNGATAAVAKHSTPSAPPVVEVGGLPSKPSLGGQQQDSGTLETSTTPQGRSSSTTRRGSIEESLGIDYSRFEEEPEEVAAWVIHAALIGFFSLVCLSLVLAFVVIRSYGFLTLVFLGVLVGFCIGLAIFVDRTVLQKNEKLKPIRNKIAFAVAVTKNAIQEEFSSFKNEWREYHLLLTNGEDGGDADNVGTTTKRKKKSIMFKMVKPFLGAKKKLFKRKRKQAKGSQPTPTPAVELV